MAENPEEVRIQLQRMRKGIPPVDWAQEREKFNAWMPANVDVMRDMRIQNRRFEVLMHLRQMEDGIGFFEDGLFVDFRIWRHYRRMAMLDDPNEVYLQWNRIQNGNDPVDQELEGQLYDLFVIERQEDMDMLAQKFINGPVYRYISYLQNFYYVGVNKQYYNYNSSCLFLLQQCLF